MVVRSFYIRCGKEPARNTRISGLFYYWTRHFGGKNHCAMGYEEALLTLIFAFVGARGSYIQLKDVQATITWSTIETLKKIRNMFKVNNKNTRKTSF